MAGSEAGLWLKNRLGSKKSLKEQELYCRGKVLNKKEAGSYVLLGIILWESVTFLFYRSFVVGAVTMPVFGCFYMKKLIKHMKIRKNRRLRAEFMETAGMLSSMLRTGYSFETAMEAVRKQLVKLHGEQSTMAEVLSVMLRQLDVGIPAEEIWQAFADECRIPEVEEFCKAFAMAKRSGASIPAILQKVTGWIALRIQTQEQIDVMLAGKLLEQNIMSIMPAAILVYVSVVSPQLLEPMYTTAAGRLIMTVCLALYIFAYLLGQYFIQPEGERRAK